MHEAQGNPEGAGNRGCLTVYIIYHVKPSPMAPRDLPTEHATQLLQLLPFLTKWTRALVSRVGADLELSLRQYAALRGIEQGVRSATDLARRWEVTPAVVTGVIDRLERRGLVRREADPNDRRRLFLALTPRGQKMSRSVDEQMTRELASHLERATQEDLQALGRTLALLHHALGAPSAPNAPPPSPDEPPAPRASKTGRRRPLQHVERGARARRLSQRTTR